MPYAMDLFIGLHFHLLLNLCILMSFWFCFVLFCFVLPVPCVIFTFFVFFFFFRFSLTRQNSDTGQLSRLFSSLPTTAVRYGPSFLSRVELSTFFPS